MRTVLVKSKGAPELGVIWSREHPRCTLVEGVLRSGDRLYYLARENTPIATLPGGFRVTVLHVDDRLDPLELLRLGCSAVMTHKAAHARAQAGDFAWPVVTPLEGAPRPVGLPTVAGGSVPEVLEGDDVVELARVGGVTVRTRAAELGIELPARAAEVVG